MSIILCIVSTKGERGQDYADRQPGRLLGRSRPTGAARVDAGPQSTLSIYYALEEQAPAGLIADTRTEGVVSRAAIAGLDLIYLSSLRFATSE